MAMATCCTSTVLAAAAPRPASKRTQAHKGGLRVLPSLGGLLGAAGSAHAGVPYGSAAPSIPADVPLSFGGAAPSLPSLPTDLPAVDLPDVSALLADPLLLGGAVAALVVPAGVALLFGGGGGGPSAKGVPAAKAAEALSADQAVVLVDIRSKGDVKEQGAPNLKGLSKRGALALPYTAVRAGGGA